MFATFFVAVLAATSMATARMDARSETRRSNAPAHYAEGYLERYDVYHTRYEALKCKEKHNTAFFDKCCHPMLATETLTKNRPAECNPANMKQSPKSSMTAAPKSTPAPVDDGDECTEGEEDCVCEGDDDEEPVSSPKSSAMPKQVASSTKKAAASAAPKQPSNTAKARTGGVATYFWQNNNAGACGIKHKDTDFIAAIDERLYGDSGKASQYCGRKILITRVDTGKTVTVTVADDCPSCINANSIDLSHGAFNAIATDAEGQVPISWVWL